MQLSFMHLKHFFTIVVFMLEQCENNEFSQCNVEKIAVDL